MIDKLVSVVEKPVPPPPGHLESSYFKELTPCEGEMLPFLPAYWCQTLPKHIQTGVLTGTGNNDCSVRHASPVDNIRPMHSHM